MDSAIQCSRSQTNAHEPFIGPCPDSYIAIPSLRDSSNLNWNRRLQTILFLFDLETVLC